eukprot:CAMPEP_0206215570 /NCGR_PEP_ID=MMETSP0047_2-20121206/2265_1 /ASSEMBLY_ACC=CAM_ASM_000192 /TAXON_ID=195065 /ORGANISM="Chroomonas mesostigmatica_cf, Strain CCMP1168" /LENGTH=346 /DNA_ID=CAMNT_0053637873 /DNA_START=219 /DNA_END=1262 /DNA_ORIENTATION=+
MGTRKNHVSGDGLHRGAASHAQPLARSEVPASAEVAQIHCRQRLFLDTRDGPKPRTRARQGSAQQEAADSCPQGALHWIRVRRWIRDHGSAPEDLLCETDEPVACLVGLYAQPIAQAEAVDEPVLGELHKHVQQRVQLRVVWGTKPQHRLEQLRARREAVLVVVHRSEEGHPLLLDAERRLPLHLHREGVRPELHGDAPRPRRVRLDGLRVVLACPLEVPLDAREEARVLAQGVDVHRVRRDGLPHPLLLLLKVQLFDGLSLVPLSEGFFSLPPQRLLLDMHTGAIPEIRPHCGALGTQKPATLVPSTAPISATHRSKNLLGEGIGAAAQRPHVYSPPVDFRAAAL